MSRRTGLCWSCIALLAASVAGCAAPAASHRDAATFASDVHTLRVHRRAVRKPVRDAQSDAMERIAARVDALLADRSSGETQLVASETPDGPLAPQSRDALAALGRAARSGDRTATLAAYDRLNSAR